MNLRRWIIRTLKPISILVGKLHYAPKSRSLMCGAINSMLGVLQAGDVLVSFSSGELTNFFIEGAYKHAAMYVGNGRVVEAVGHGVSCLTFEEFCSSKDRIAILRPMFCTKETCKIAAMNVVSQIGKPYDYYFEAGESAFYCAELITWAYTHATMGASPFTKREIMGAETVLPIDFYNAKAKFEVVMECPSK